MIWTLFFSFLKIGCVSFGGGYAMIAIMRDTVLANGWLTEEEFLDFIAVSESTPGPFAINMSTFIGSSQAGILGAIMATLGVVLPSFIIILIISSIMRSLLKYEGVQAFLGGVRPCVIGLIVATSLTLLLSTLFGFRTIGDAFVFDYKPVVILAILFAAGFLFKKLFKKKVSPIIMILFSAGLGMLFYGIK